MLSNIKGMEMLEPCGPKGPCTGLRGLGAGNRVRLPDTRAERMAGAKFLQWAMFWTFEKRTVANYVQSGGFGDADSGITG